MTFDQAKELARRLKGLMPRMTDAQVICIAELLERYPPKASAAAISAYALAHEDFNLARFATEIRRRCMRAATGLDARPPAYPGSEEHRQTVKAYIAGLSDRQLARAKDRVLAEMSESTRAFLVGANPRSSAVLNSLIYERRFELRDELNVEIEPLTQQGAS